MKLLLFTFSSDNKQSYNAETEERIVTTVHNLRADCSLLADLVINFITSKMTSCIYLMDEGVKGSIVHPFSHYPHKSMVLVNPKERQEMFRLIVSDTCYVLK